MKWQGSADNLIIGVQPHIGAADHLGPHTTDHGLAGAHTTDHGLAGTDNAADNVYTHNKSCAVPPSLTFIENTRLVRTMINDRTGVPGNNAF